MPETLKTAKIELGSTVKDKITSFRGVVVGRSEWLYGCVRMAVQGTDLKDGKPTDAVWFDESQLEFVKAPAKNLFDKPGEEKPPQGPRADASRSTDPRR